jgi:type 1 fimbria pilin
MRLRATILAFLLFSCAFGVAGKGCFATTIASTDYVDSKIENTGSAIVIQNTSNTPATLSQNPQTTSIQTSSNKEVATIGWTDEYRTSKVKSVSGNNTALVNMWIE